MISKKEFTEQVERLLSKKSSIQVDVLGAIIKVCEDNNLEPEGAKRLLSDPLKQKLEAEAKQLNLIDRGKNTKGTITSFFK
tara:strand:+ start:734 stop:976 length:243 start_codon:yes stop_codon:yes gene_type:complete